MNGIPFTSTHNPSHQGNQASQQTFAFRRAEKHAAVRPGFIRALSDGNWHKGRDLCQQLETDERTLRGLASESVGSVISGQLGYRLTAHATTSEIDHAENFYRSQARQMLRRAIQVRKARNAGGRVA